MSLRHGFTTGTAAAAAAKAATIRLLTGVQPLQVNVALPMGTRMSIPVMESAPAGDGIMAAVVKDGGDDPDITHKAVIRAVVRRRDAGFLLDGGNGVGRVTRPGLPVAVGEAAINPVPRAQIRQAALEACTDAGFPGGLEVEIRVDNGEELARRTFNPRLGIVGGISILGTRGTVKPFSHQAYRATISQCLDVILANKLPGPCLTTGGRSERFLRQLFPHIQDTACVQVADFFAFSMQEVARRGFEHVLWAVFFGKLIKQAQGLSSTHARQGELNLRRLAAWSAQCGMDASLCQRIASANTAMQALEEIKNHPQAHALFALLVHEAAHCAVHFAGRTMQVDYLLFDFSGQLLHSTLEAA